MVKHDSEFDDFLKKRKFEPPRLDLPKCIIDDALEEFGVEEVYTTRYKLALYASLAVGFFFGFNVATGGAGLESMDLTSFMYIDGGIL